MTARPFPTVKRSIALAGSRVSAPLRSFLESRPRPSPPIAQLLQHYGPAGHRSEVLLFGDSVMNCVSRYDRNVVPLGRMLKDRLALQYQTCVVAEDGYHPEVFRVLTEVLLTLPNRPKLVILAINIRCFSPQWDLNPDWQHQDVIDGARGFLADPTAGVPVTLAPRPSEEDRHRYAATVVSCPGRPEATVAYYLRQIETRPANPEAALERSRDIFSFHYLPIAVSQSRRLHSLQALLRRFRQLGCKVLCYVTPVNHEAGGRLLGRQFGESTSSTVATIQRAASAEPWSPNHFTFADWSELLPSRSFFHDLDPTEHLNEEGRIRVSIEAAGVAARLLASDNAALH